MKTHTITVQESEDEGHELVVFYYDGKITRSATHMEPAEYDDPTVSKIEKNEEELSIQELEIYGCSESDWLNLDYIDLRE